MLKALAFVLCLLLSACTSLERATGVDRVVQAGIADTATTAVALNLGAHEMNPLGFGGATVGKLFYLYKRQELPEEERVRYDRFATSIWSGAAASNALQLAVPGSGLLLGLGFGVWVGLSIWTGW